MLSFGKLPVLFIEKLSLERNAVFCFADESELLFALIPIAKNLKLLAEFCFLGIVEPEVSENGLS